MEFKLKRIMSLCIVWSMLISVIPAVRAEGNMGWYLAKEIKFNTTSPTADDHYSIRYNESDNLVDITADTDSGLTITQKDNTDLSTKNDVRPEVTVDFTDLINDTGKYYLELTFKGNVTKGKQRMEFKAQDITKEAGRFSMTTNKYMEANAKVGASRVDVTNTEKIEYVQNEVKTVGLLYDMTTKTFQYVNEREVNAETYQNNWGTGLGGIWVSCQSGAAGNYINLISAKLYEYGESPEQPEETEKPTESETPVESEKPTETETPEPSETEQPDVVYPPEIIETGNIALNKTASSNSVINDTYSASMAVDGNNSTRLATVDGTDNAGKWLMVDFGKAEIFNSVKLYQWRSRIRNYKIQYSNDGENWNDTSIGEQTSNIAYNDSGSQAHTWINIPKFNPVTARYIRILFTSNEPGDSGISIFEFQVYNDMVYTEEMFRSDIESLTLESILGENTSNDNIITNLAKLPLGLVNGASVTWSSSDEKTVNTGGTVTKDTFEDKKVVLTAVITSPQKTMTENVSFELTVKKKNSDELMKVFESDIKSLSDSVILKENKSFDYVISGLNLSTALEGQTRVEWTSSDECLDALTGEVKRPIDSDRTVKLKATFTLAGLTRTKEYTVTVKKETNAQEDIFLGEYLAVTEEKYLGANSDKNNIKFDLNLPISPLSSGVEITWSSNNEDVIDTDGKIRRGDKDTTVVLTAAVALKDGENILFSRNKTLTYTVKALDGEALWKHTDSVAFDNKNGTSNYFFNEYNKEKAAVSIDKDGVKIEQATASGFAEAERPNVDIDLSNHLSEGKSYYIRVSYRAQMKKGSVRVYMNNNSGGEATLLELKSTNGANISVAAKTSSGAREWIDSQLSMKHYQNTDESFGIIYNLSNGSFRFVQNDVVVKDTSYTNSYGAGFGGIRLNFQGADGGVGSYITLRGVDVYECDDALMNAVSEAAAEITKDLITEQTAELIYKDLNSLPTNGKNNTKITWTSSDESVISKTGKVQRGTEDKNVTLTAVIERSDCRIEQSFDFVVIGTQNSSAEFDVDISRIIASAEKLGLKTDSEAEITDNIDMSMLIAQSEFGNTITYSSSDEMALKSDGTIVRDAESDKSVSLICTISNGTREQQIEFKMTIKAKGNNIEGNLAAGKKAVSPSKSESDCGPENAVDQRYTTKWFTSGGPKQPYITVDLGEEQLIAAVILREAADGTEYKVKSAKIETSTNGNNYTTAVQLNGVGEERTAVFAPVKARYIRYTVTEKDAGNTGLYEMIIKYTPNAADVVKFDKENFKWPYEYVVTSDLDLPVKGEYGSQITWSSSVSSLISDTGKVTRPQIENNNENRVVLTATFTYGKSTESIQILCKVKALTETNNSNSSSGGGGSGGGKGGVTAGIGTLDPNDDKVPPIVDKETQTFADVSESRWSYKYIQKLYDRGVVSGDGERFYPERAITREELVKIVIDAFEIQTENGDTGFEDVKSGAWYEKYIYTAKKNGIIEGISKDEFGVGMPVTRQDMAVIIYRAVKNKGILSIGTGMIESFADSEQISDYAYDAVDSMTSGGIINGMDNGNFEPFNNASREQCATVICKIIK